MVKGRRTRQANTTSQLLSAASVTDGTASPKRKDFKYDNNGSNFTHNNNVNDNKHSKPSLADGTLVPMVLRGGRSKTNEITQYFTNSEKFPASTILNNVPVANVASYIDLTDDNTYDSFGNIASNVLNPQGNDSPLAGIDFNLIKSNPASNIFLQEPVLSLNIDKSSTDQSRIVIKNSFLTTDIQNKFSPPKCEPMWGNVTDMTQVQREPIEHALDLSKPTQVTSIDSTTFLNQDSNSCDSGDSGVVILPSGTLEQAVQLDGTRRKPATPHRILCPSPVKNPIVASPSKALAHLNIQNKRATRRNAKSKRRLHTKELENALEETVSETTIGHSLPVGTEPAVAAPAKELIDKKKPVLNDSVNPTAQQNTNNNNQSNKQSEGSAVVTTGSKSETGGNKKLTDFFQVRRSVRKTKKEVQWERDRDIEKAIREERETGLKIACFDGKGRGIITTRPFSKGEFVVEYIGDLITVSEARQREQIYAEDDNTGCYMYYFKHKNVQHCIDATAESGKLGRLVNHSRNGNLMTKTVSLNNRPHLVLIAKEDISEGVEVTYDYGDRSKESLQHHPWLAF
ncbi:N-lysine methyltransferase KMT5A [Malaya genurostris]|uniref:N-lysine methyltransferase KMT5A n=1 Tax=Malaya genurostris TaxID=325434 RepID=UPI0026F3B9A6|nr:N-lysine methyltransferase KMT5A [Malaya genurostris]XP_058457067.1 N-lysine methyltransferase KMT5A [Malaya genurostris]